MLIRRAKAEDAEAIWSVIAPAIRAGESYALEPDLSREDALAYWTSSDRRTFVAEEEGRIVGTFYIRPNQRGGGSHVGNGGYATSPAARGRGIARRMGEHSLEEARRAGFRAMQFNFVVSTNAAAVHLWQSLGFAIVGRLPGAFNHPVHGHVDALVMFRPL